MLENDHLRLISIPKILTILNDGVVLEKNLMFNKTLRFFKYWEYRGKITFKTIYNRIVESLLIKNFDQQDYRIKFTKKLKAYYYQLEDSCTRFDDYSSVLKKGMKLASANNMSIEEYISSTLKRSIKRIVTGKNHSAKIIDMSPATSIRVLNRMHSEKTLYRIVKTTDLGKVTSQEQLDAISDVRSGRVVITSTGRVKHFLGSVVSLNIPSYVIQKRGKRYSTSTVGIKK